MPQTRVQRLRCTLWMTLCMGRLQLGERPHAVRVVPLRPLAPLLCWWWLVVPVLVLVAAGAMWRDLGPDAPHRYLVRQQVAIVMLPLLGAAANYDIYVARAQEERVARAIVQ